MFYSFGNSQKVFVLQYLYSKFAKIFSKAPVDFIYARSCIIHKWKLAELVTLSGVIISKPFQGVEVQRLEVGVEVKTFRKKILQGQRNGHFNTKKKFM